MAHVLYRHHASDWFEKTQKYAAQSISLAEQYKGMLGKGDGDSSTAILVDLGAEITNRVIAPNLWSRSQEEEADLLGIDIMVKAGYNAELATRPLNKLGEWQAERRKAAVEAEKKSEEARDKSIEDSLNSNNPGAALSGIFKAVVSGAGKATGALMKELGGEEHPSPTQREKTIMDYVEREHPKTFDVRPRPTPWDEPKNKMAVILRNYENTHLALSLLDKDLKRAEILIRKAVRGPTANDTLPRYVFSKIRQKGGKKRLSIKNLELALRGKEPGFIIFRDLIERYTNGGRTKDALTTITQASDRLGNPPHLLPYRIALMVDAKRKGEAIGLHSKCKIQHSALASRCDLALNGLKAYARNKNKKEKKSATERLINYKAKKVGGKLPQSSGNSSTNNYTD